MNADRGLFAQTINPPLTEQLPVGNAKEVALQRAREHIAYGLDLGSRQAIYSAQTEFIQALRLIARELDKGSGAHAREEALDAGLRTLENLDRPKSIMEMQQRLFFVQDRLAFSGGHEPVASMALYAMGRSHVAIANEMKEDAVLTGPKAIALYQAALTVDPANYLAVNELGVLFARCGQLEDAERVFIHGIQTAPQPQMWRNLSVIHEKMGKIELAKQDRMQYDALAAAGQANGQNPQRDQLAAMVRWTEPAEFVRSSPRDEFDLPPAQPGAQTSQTKAAETPAPPAKISALPVPQWMAAALKGFDNKSSANSTR